MIIELFGPPGVGKTTLAFALVDRLRKRGHDVRPIFSYRPSEDPLVPLKDPTRPTATAAARRLLRPAFAIEALGSVCSAFAGARETGIPANLMRLLPPKNIIWSIRLHQYMSRLARSWADAAVSRQMALFDQGFVQAVCSLALLSRTADQELIALALKSTPRADLLIKLQAPREILEARLAERQRRQGRLEQLFELDLKTTLDSIPIIDRLYELMRREGQSVMCVDSVDRQALCDAVDRIEWELMASRDPTKAAIGGGKA
jgi:thymidylate kinase